MSARAVLFCALLGGALHAAACAELVFRVPDVRVQHEAAPDRPVGTGVARPVNSYQESAKPAKGTTKAPPLVANYPVLHAVSTPDAREALKHVMDMEEMAEQWGCGKCTREEIAYCDWQVLADHCCCDFDFAEPFPYIPHTCYFDPVVPCSPIAADCNWVVRLRQCCCDRRLAEKWSKILSSSSKTLVMPLLILIGPILTTIFRF